MRKLLLPSVALLGCWTSSKPASAPTARADGATGGAAYGGAAYGGATYGILGAQALGQGGAFASLTGTGDISSGFDDENVYGGLIGSDPNAAPVGGLGVRGAGVGGGGTGTGTIGVGRYGTIGQGSGGGGTGSGYGSRLGYGPGRGQSAPGPSVKLGQPSQGAGLDPAIIRRYIKRNLQKIRYCYEKQLLVQPALAGTVKLTFTIGPDGRVSSATGAGLRPVDACVASVVRQIEFPQPQGGAAVTVNYPFLFAATGEP